MAVYQQGDTIRIEGSFADLAGVLTDPDTITLQVMPPSRVAVQYTYALAQVVKTATGRYAYDLALNASGDWVYRWVVTGAVAAATEDVLVRVQPTVFQV